MRKPSIERPFYLEKLKSYTGSDIIRVITGVRRCGKSSLLLIYKAWLEEQYGEGSVIYLSFDGPDFILDKSLKAMNEAIKKAREANHLTQEQLGEKIGVQRAQISRLEKGRSVITLPTIEKVFKALGIKTASLDLGTLGRVALW